MFEKMTHAHEQVAADLMTHNHESQVIGLITRQVFLTLAYSAQFGQPLTAIEIRKRLFLPRIGRLKFWYFLTKSTEKQLIFIKKVLSRLEGWGWVVERLGFYALSTHQKDLLLSHERRHIAERKLFLASGVGGLLGLWPWIRAVYISGSVAAGYAGPHDDIDFYIVVRPASLWVTRPLVVGLAWLFGHRRSWAKEEPSSWCFNMWSEDRSLVLPTKTKTLYSAYEFAQLKLVWGELGSNDIWNSNPWVFQLLPLANLGENIDYSFATKITSSLRELFSLIVFPIVWLSNLIAYKLQSIYMQSHRTRETVELERAFFHPRDTKRLIYTSWKREVLDVLSPE